MIIIYEEKAHESTRILLQPKVKLKDYKVWDAIERENNAHTLYASISTLNKWSAFPYKLTVNKLATQWNAFDRWTSNLGENLIILHGQHLQDTRDAGAAFLGD